MKPTSSLVAGVLLSASLASAAVIEKRNSNSFAGTSNYYLHALHPAEQASYISALKGFGTKVVRLWDGCEKSSNTQSTPDYEDTIGTYNTATLDALDAVLAQLHTAGIKAIISPHDANLLPPTGSSSGYNGIDIYGTTYTNSDNFYSSTTAKAQYDARLKSILEYTSPSFNKQWKDLSEVILAFDIQNEPLIASPGKLADNDPDDWVCGRAGNMKTILGDSDVKIATGGCGGSQYDGHEYNLFPKALECSAIDIMSVHGYMDQASNWGEFVPSLSDQASSAGKHMMVEEWGVGTTSAADSIADQAAVFNDNGVPWLYWMIISGMSLDESCSGQGACCHQGLSTDVTEDFEVGLASSRANWTTLIQKADSTTGRQDWTGFVY